MDEKSILVLMSRGDWANAESACREAIYAVPGNPRFHGYLGMCLLRQGRDEDAAVSFERATILDPQFWEAGIKHAQCLDRLKKYEEAYVVAKRWERLRPNDRIIKGLLMGLEMRGLKKGPTQGWERSTHVGTSIKMSRDL